MGSMQCLEANLDRKLNFDLDIKNMFEKVSLTL